MRLRLTVPRLLAGVLLPVGFATPFWGPPVLRNLDVFRVERVEVSGTHLLAPHEVVASSGIRLGQSVWEDPRAWEEALGAHPAVEAASVERALPGTLRVRITERRPVALVEAGTLRPATADGEVLPVDPSRAPVDLPLLRVAGLAASDGRIEDPDARHLLSEMGRIAQLDPSLLPRVSEVRRTPTGELLLLLSQPVIELLLPPAADSERLRQLRAVLDDLERRAPRHIDGRSTSRVRIDLRFADQVVLRLSSAP
ncbi:hypothetical protein BH23GEM3_BH23GEM3_16430 [soil metagenome]